MPGALRALKALGCLGTHLCGWWWRRGGRRKWHLGLHVVVSRPSMWGVLCRHMAVMILGLHGSTPELHGIIQLLNTTELLAGQTFRPLKPLHLIWGRRLQTDLTRLKMMEIGMGMCNSVLILPVPLLPLPVRQRRMARLPAWSFSKHRRREQRTLVLLGVLELLIFQRHHFLSCSIRPRGGGLHRLQCLCF